jgi:IclR family acetate operon transcriptional repressor
MRTVRAVERALKILMFIARHGKSEGLSEISRKLNLDKATVLRLLFTLESQGLVRQQATTKNYELGPAVTFLSGSAKFELRQFCKPYLDKLFRQTKETVCLVCPHGFDRTHVEVIPAQHALRLVPNIGSSWPIYVGASGRVMMAFMKRAQVERIIEETQLAPRNAAFVPTEDEIYTDLSRVQRQGYLISAGETDEGGAAVAAPVFEDGGQVVGAIAVRGPHTRLTRAVLESYAPLVRNVTLEISREFGFKVNPLSREWLAELGWKQGALRKATRTKRSLAMGVRRRSK